MFSNWIDFIESKVYCCSIMISARYNWLSFAQAKPTVGLITKQTQDILSHGFSLIWQIPLIKHPKPWMKLRRSIFVNAKINQLTWKPKKWKENQRKCFQCFNYKPSMRRSQQHSSIMAVSRHSVFLYVYLIVHQPPACIHMKTWCKKMWASDELKEIIQLNRKNPTLPEPFK